MVAKKHKSNRQSCRQKYKIERKVRESNRKARKEMKKNPALRSKKSKDPGIPNLWPFKEQLLSQIEESRDREAQKSLEIKQRKVELANQNPRKDQMDDSVKPLKPNNQSSYYREFHKILEKADVILQVIDARDPIGTRAKHIENMILESGTNKRVILVLNKVDLVPKSNVVEWLAYLRHEFPTIAFKASTQSQRRNLGQASGPIEHASEGMLNSSEALGTEALIKLLKNYTRSIDVKTSITVGVIGYPNVGKSSLINSLKRSKVCNTGSIAGLTRHIQEIQLDKNIKLIDSPGIVFTPERKDASWTERASVMLRNCIRLDSITDPIVPVELILTRASKPSLMMLYAIPTFESVTEFLFHIAKARGKLLKGGVPDIDAGARIVINDWNSGKIPFYSIVPKRDLGGSNEIVHAFGDALDLDQDVLVKLDAAQPREFIQFPSVEYLDSGLHRPDTTMVDQLNDASMDDDSMDQDPVHDTDNNYIVVPEIHSKNPNSSSNATLSTSTSSKQVFMTQEETLLNPQINKDVRKSAKRAKKQASKQHARLSVMSDLIMNMDLSSNEAQTGSSDAYDFGEFAWRGSA